MRNSGDDGGMARRIATFDWRTTALGDATTWPRGLKSAIDMMLGCGFPAILWVGNDETALYNDAYAALIAEDNLGRAGLDALESARSALAPALEIARRGETAMFEDRPLSIRRGGAVEDGWFTLSCSPVRDEAGAVLAVLLILVETTERVRAGRARNLLIAELQHRVRNILAVIRSIAHRTAETSDTVESLSAHLDGRLAALSRTQALLARNAQGGADLETLVLDELLAQVADEHRIAIDGPEILLTPKAAEVMTLAVHELATNANKYGALADPLGRIAIRWAVASRDGAAWLRFEWRESGVKIAAAAPRRVGFGEVLIEQRVPYELMGAGRLIFAPGGVRCEIEFPLTPLRSVLQAEAG